MNNKLSIKNRHLRFDDDECEITNTLAQKVEIDRQTDYIPEDPSCQNPWKTSSREQLRVVLVKSSVNETFGFELRGDELRRGENCVDSLEPNSVAIRFGLNVGDRLLKVNGYQVDKLNITELFSLIECETNINPSRLELIVMRSVPVKRSNKSDRYVYNKIKTRNYCNIFFYLFTSYLFQ